jgi:regulator of sigma E protease
MDILISIFAFLVVLTPVVFFHELGHYWAARRSGVTVEIFSVGFGPEIYGFTDKRGTRWKFSWIPLGGYVSMAGDAGATSAPTEEGASVKGSFQSSSLKARTFIVAMGPIANFILGIAIITGLYIGFGKVTVPTVVGDVQPGSAAETAGLQINDEIIAVEGNRVRDFNALRGIIFENPGRPLLVTILRGGREIDLTVTPDTVDDKCIMASYGRLGVVSVGGELEALGPVNALMTASVDSFGMSAAMLRGIGRLASGNANRGEIGGPVKIAEISGRVASQGLISFAFFVAVISINLGLVNLLPVPSLDGGHLVFFGLEAIMGRPLSPQVQGLIMRIGMALLLGLILMVTFFDITNVFMSEC